MRMPELLDDHPTDGLVAAMTVEQHDGPEPLCERGLEDIADIGEHRFVADRERAAEIHMVRRTADLELRKDEDAIRHPRLDLVEEILTDHRVRSDWQVRAVGSEEHTYESQS